MKPTITALLTSALLTIGVPVANAQVPIQDLQRHSGITISGTIRSVVGNDFILDDGTGQVIVDAGPMRYHQLNLQPGEQVTVTGRYGRHDFDAFTITRSNGEVISIRDPYGPPPWSGGYRRRNSSFRNFR